jgi:hypothetical protein
VNWPLLPIPTFNAGDVVEVTSAGRGWDPWCYYSDGEKHSLYTIIRCRGEVTGPYFRRGSIEGVLVQLYMKGTFALEGPGIVVEPHNLMVISLLDLLAEAGG